MTKPHAREWPLKKSPCKTIPEMNDEGLGHNHHTQEWDSEVVQNDTTIGENHQGRKDNSTNIEPLERLTERTIADKTPNKQVSRQWNKCLKEG